MTFGPKSSKLNSRPVYYSRLYCSLSSVCNISRQSCQWMQMIENLVCIEFIRSFQSIQFDIKVAAIHGLRFFLQSKKYERNCWKIIKEIFRIFLFHFAKESVGLRSRYLYLSTMLPKSKCIYLGDFYSTFAMYWDWANPKFKAGK